MTTRQRHFITFLLTAFAGLFAAPSASAMLDPSIGQYIQRDPIGYPDGMNSYAGYFALVSSVDPSGLTTLSNAEVESKFYIDEATTVPTFAS